LKKHLVANMAIVLMKKTRRPVAIIVDTLGNSTSICLTSDGALQVVFHAYCNVCGNTYEHCHQFRIADILHM
jgi:hypothetical protein